MAIPFDPERRFWHLLRDADVDLQRKRFAAHSLSSMLRQRGKSAAAERILRDSLKAHGSEEAARTWIRLGRLLDEDENRAAEARAAYRRAEDLATVEETPEVLIDLGGRCVEEGETERARSHYERVAALAFKPSLRALAAYRLAVVEMKLEEPVRAETALRHALVEADAALAPFVFVDLAALLSARGEALEAAELLERAIATDHHDQAPQAALALAFLRRTQGEALEAYRLFQLVAESEHPRYAPEAAQERDRIVLYDLDALLGPTVTLAPRGAELGSHGPGGKSFLVVGAGTHLTRVNRIEGSPWLDWGMAVHRRAWNVDLGPSVRQAASAAEVWSKEAVWGSAWRKFEVEPVRDCDRAVLLDAGYEDEERNSIHVSCLQRSGWSGPNPSPGAIVPFLGRLSAASIRFAWLAEVVDWLILSWVARRSPERRSLRVGQRVQGEMCCPLCGGGEGGGRHSSADFRSKPSSGVFWLIAASLLAAEDFRVSHTEDDCPSSPRAIEVVGSSQE